jgi:hypothetical protein
MIIKCPICQREFNPAGSTLGIPIQGQDNRFPVCAVCEGNGCWHEYEYTPALGIAVES